MANDTSASSRRRLVGVSTKMYFSHAQTVSYIQSCLPLGTLASQLSVDIFIIPDFLSIPTASTLLDGSSIQLGAQDCHWEDQGAFTGSISPSVLRSHGVSIVELGHAERRRLFHENDADVVKKAVAAQRNGMTPLVCIGEKTRAANARDAVTECMPQLLPVLDAVPGEVILAYEPVWAIGAAEPAEASYVVEVTKEIRKLCVEAGRGEEVRILYGGSAGPGTFAKIEKGVDGLFLGRFAHDVKNFGLVIREVARRV